MALFYLLVTLAMRVVFAGEDRSNAFEFHQHIMIEDKVQCHLDH
jgi:hypothetical protein